MDIKKTFRNIVDFLFQPEEEIQFEPKKSQETIKAEKEKIYTFNDLKFRHDNHSDMVYADIEFKNGYHMYISVKDYTEGFDQEFLKHKSPAGYEIAIVDSKGRKNSTCLNKDGKDLIAYDKNAVTTLMKKIQQLDEKGHLTATHNVISVEARRKHLLKMRERREADKKNHPEDAVSGVKVADKIAAAVISRSEQRPITPSVALEYRKKELSNSK